MWLGKVLAVAQDAQSPDAWLREQLQTSITANQPELYPEAALKQGEGEAPPDHTVCPSQMLHQACIAHHSQYQHRRSKHVCFVFAVWARAAAGIQADR